MKRRRERPGKAWLRIDVQSVKVCHEQRQRARLERRGERQRLELCVQCGGLGPETRSNVDTQT